MTATCHKEATHISGFRTGVGKCFRTLDYRWRHSLVYRRNRKAMERTGTHWTCSEDPLMRSDIGLLRLFPSNRIRVHQDVASQYFRSGADKVSIGSDAVLEAER